MARTGNDGDQHPTTPGGLSWMLHELAVAVARLDVALARALGLNATDYLAMKHLITSDEPLGPGELGALVGLTSGAATTLVDRLERGGHVRRVPHVHDRRRLVLDTTPTARDAVTRALRPLERELVAVAELRDRAELDVIGAYLRAVVDVYRAPGSAPPASGE